MSTTITLYADPNQAGLAYSHDTGDDYIMSGPAGPNREDIDRGDLADFIDADARAVIRRIKSADLDVRVDWSGKGQDGVLCTITTTDLVAVLGILDAS